MALEERGTESCRMGDVKHPYVPEQSRALHETASQLSLETTAACQTLVLGSGLAEKQKRPWPCTSEAYC